MWCLVQPYLVERSQVQSANSDDAWRGQGGAVLLTFREDDWTGYFKETKIEKKSKVRMIQTSLQTLRRSVFSEHDIRIVKSTDLHTRKIRKHFRLVLKLFQQPDMKSHWMRGILVHEIRLTQEMSVTLYVPKFQQFPVSLFFAWEKFTNLHFCFSFSHGPFHSFSFRSLTSQADRFIRPTWARGTYERLQSLGAAVDFISVPNLQHEMNRQVQ